MCLKVSYVIASMPVFNCHKYHDADLLSTSLQFRNNATEGQSHTHTAPIRKYNAPGAYVIIIIIIINRFLGALVVSRHLRRLNLDFLDR